MDGIAANGSPKSFGELCRVNFTLPASLQCSLTYKGIHLQGSHRRFFLLFCWFTYKGIHLQGSHFEIIWCLLTHLYGSCRRNFSAVLHRFQPEMILLEHGMNNILHRLSVVKTIQIQMVHEQSSETFDVSWIFMSSFSAHQIQLIIDTQKKSL